MGRIERLIRSIYRASGGRGKHWREAQRVVRAWVRKVKKSAARREAAAAR